MDNSCTNGECANPWFLKSLITGFLIGLAINVFFGRIIFRVNIERTTTNIPAAI